MTLADFKRVGKLPIVNRRLNKLASWSEISFLSSFNALFGIAYGAVALLISRDQRISLVSSLSVKERKKGVWAFVCEVISLIFLWIFYFSLGLSADNTEIIVENICNSFLI